MKTRGSRRVATVYSIHTFETSFGWVALLGADSGIRRSSLPCDSPDACVSDLGAEAEGAVAAPERFAELQRRLVAYFDGQDENFDDVPLDLDGAAEFHRRAWAACRTIPRGETRTYKWLARAAGSPKAARAAGQSMAKNKAPIIVPCHRVIGTDGGLRGFGSGKTRLDLKRRLLDMERGTSGSLI